MTLSRFCLTTVIILATMTLGSLLSGCDELVDATHGAKGTKSMQSRREKRNNDAIKILDDAPKSNR